jgi:hypothetical protein
LSSTLKNFFVIGGTEKAGTTSLFEYFANHPSICSSKSKETDYFRRGECELYEYQKLFHKPLETHSYFMEGSPSYLGLPLQVIPQIKKMNIDVKFLFVLRDPIERIKSSYLFHRSKLYIPESLDINQYVSLCLNYQQGKIGLADTPFAKDWFLNVLGAGSYKKHLQLFLDEFPNSIKLIDFNQLKSAPDSVVKEICNFLEIDSNYFNQFEYFKANKTFQSKNHFIHRLGMFFNNTFESFFRKNPKIKQKLVGFYKRANSVKSISGTEFSQETIQRLQAYYQEDVAFLSLYFKQEKKYLNWRYFNE